MTASINIIEILALPIFFKSVFNQHPPPINQLLIVQFRLRNEIDIHEFTLEKSKIPNHLPEYFDSQNSASESMIYSQIQKKEHISIKSSESQCLRYAQDPRLSHENPKLCDANAIKIKNEASNELKISLTHQQQNLQDILVNEYIKTAYGRHQIIQDQEFGYLSSFKKSHVSKKTGTSLSQVNSNSFCIKNEMSYKINGKDLVKLHLDKLQREQELMGQYNIQYHYLNCILQDQLNGKRYRIYIKYDLKYEEAKIYCGGFGATMTSTLKSIIKLGNKDKKNENVIERKYSMQQNKTQRQIQFVDLSKKPKIKSSIYQEQDIKSVSSSGAHKKVKIEQIKIDIVKQDTGVSKSQCCLLTFFDR